MTVSSNTNNNVGTTDRDAELARSLQEQFRHEAEAAGLTSSFFRSAVGRPASASGTSNNEQRASLVAAAASGGTRRSNSNSGSGSSGSGGDGHNQSTPKYKKSSSSTSNNNSTPDTAASTPSPSHRGRLTLLEEQHQQRHQHQQFELEGQERKKRSTPRSSSTRSSPRGSPRSSPRTSPRGSPRSSPRSSPRNSFSLANFFFVPAASSDMNDTSNDEHIARRLEQALRDAELASQLAQQERASGDFGVVANTTNTTTRSGSSAMGPVVVGGASLRPDGGFGTDGFEQNNALPLQHQRRSQSQNNDCRGKAMYYSTRIFLSLLIAAITFIVFITMFGGSSGTPDVLDPSTWMPGYPELDPSLGSVGEHNKWKPPNGQNEWSDGLQLTVLNNLKSGSGWSDYLKTSLSEWNNGSPDAVTLNMREMSNDPDCRAVRRAMKVCNGNYGPTDWRGVNQILLQDEYIITSLAKMNDYYLDGTNRAQKQYTMCHELGEFCSMAFLI